MVDVGGAPLRQRAVGVGPSRGDPVLAEIVRRLVEAYKPESIYLFGSVARGEARVGSDYDVLVVVPDDAPPERKRSRLAYEVLRGTGAAADVLVALIPTSRHDGTSRRRCRERFFGRGCSSMQRDPAREEATRAWLNRASRDLLAAEHAMTAKPTLHDMAAFHCQQTAEKALKALLAWYDVPFRRDP